MSSSTSFAARILEASASAYAGAAASLLLERQPEATDRYAPTSLKDWQSHLCQRILELSAALDAEEPKIFLSRVRWESNALRARNLDPDDLHAGLVCLRDILLEELPEQARHMASSYLEGAFETLAEAPVQEVGLNPTNPRERKTLQYLEAALEGECGRAIDLVTETFSAGLSISESYEILLDAQREIGRMWHMGEIEIAEEHMVTATTERAISVLAQLAPRQPGNGKTVIVAGVADNRHGLTVRVLADFFEIAGWRSICLGADVPASDLATGTVHFDADLLALSVALPTQLKTARQTIEAVRALPERDIKILVGGGAFLEAPELWRRLGADGSIQTADAAVSLGQRLIGLGS